METSLPAGWHPWRSAPPLGGRRPAPENLARVVDSELGRQDVLPYPDDRACAGLVRLLIVGINPSPWTAAVNAPFARPGNRFWPSLAAADVLPQPVDASRGLARSDERMLAERGIGITNIVSRPTARADQLSAQELRAAGAGLAPRVREIQPAVVAVLGVTAFRVAFGLPKAQLGRQPVHAVPDWPAGSPLWVLPNPSGLNAHESVDSLAEKWAEVWAQARPGTP